MRKTVANKWKSKYILPLTFILLTTTNTSIAKQKTPIMKVNWEKYKIKSNKNFSS